MARHDSPAPPYDADAVRSLVEEVVRRITAGAAGAAGAETARTDAPSVAAIADAVVTLAHVERLPAGAREVVVSARAVVTPSARDRAREAGIAIVRGPAGSDAGIPAADGPFVIAGVDARPDAAARAAAILRAVPRAERLPATDLSDAVASLALRASRDGARGVLLTSRPALAVVVANRSPNLRAVTARDASTVARAAADAAANLLVVDPATFAAGLERACADFARRPDDVIPAELARAAAGCACKNHPHRNAP